MGICCNNVYLIYFSSGANFPDTWELNFYCDNNIMIDIAGFNHLIRLDIGKNKVIIFSIATIFHSMLYLLHKLFIKIGFVFLEI